MTIQSERLELISMSPAFMSASMARDIANATTLLGAALPEEWPDAPDLLAMRLGQLEKDAALESWLLRAIVLRRTRQMIGYIGFHTAPGAEYLEPYSPGAVEFGFTVFPHWRRQGYAREASLALMQWARESHGLRAFVLSIRPDNVASQALAKQLGFARVGSHIDEVDGEEDVLELR
jgi:[ribosomal protein S5]-alanine N-acetyltransferase